MGVNINVNDQKMEAFANYVKEFSINTWKDCDALLAAMKKLQDASSEDELVEINSMVNDIQDIIALTQPNIDALADKIMAYVLFVRKIKAKAKS